MPDITPEDFSLFVNEIRRLTGSIDQLQRAQGGTKNARNARPGEARARQREQEQDRRARDRDRSADQRNHRAEERDRKMSRATDHLGRTFSALEGDAGKVGQQLQRMAEGVPKIGLTLGVVAGQLMSFGGNLTKNYREVADAGQLFQGSMMNMAQAASDAGLPMGEFAAMVKKNTKLMAVFGVKGVADMAKRVREVTAQQGMYGYSVEGINEVTLSYLDIQRQFNVKVDRNNSQHLRNINNLAKTTTSLAAAFGTTREEILKNTADAMREFTGLVFSSVGDSQAELAQKTQAATQVMEVIANIPVIGKDTVKALDTSIRTGTASMDESWRTMASRFPEITVGVDNLAAKIANGTATMGDSVDLMVNMRDVLEKNQEAIRRDPSEAGARQRELLKQLQALDLGEDGAAFKKRQAASEAAAKSMTGFTQMLNNLESKLKLVGAEFLGGIYAGIEKATAGFDGPQFEAAFKSFSESMKTAGTSIGNMIGTVFTPANIRTIGSLLQGFAFILGKTVEVAGTALNWWSTAMGGFQEAAGILGSFIDKMLAFVGIVDKGSTVTSDAFKALTTALGVGLTALAFIRGKDALSKMLGLRNKDMTIDAQNVYINGKGGSFGDLGGHGGGGGGGGGKLGRGGRDVAETASKRSRELAEKAAEQTAKANRLRNEGRVAGAVLAERSAARAAKASAAAASIGGGISHVAADAAKGGMMGAKGLKMAGTIGKAGAKLGGKFIPGVGLVISGASAIGRAKSGDFLGAGIDGVSGLASLIPGLGTAASIGLDGINMGRDAGMFGKKQQPEAKATPKPINGPRRVPKFMKSPMGIAALGGLGAAGAGAGLAMLLLQKDKERAEKAAQKAAEKSTSDVSTPAPAAAKQLSITTEQATITMANRPSNLARPNLPAIPKSPASDLLDETRRQTSTMEKKLTDLAPDKDAPDTETPKMVQLLDKMSNIQEAQLLMQRETLELTKKSVGYQYDAKLLRDKKSRPV